MSVPPFLLKGWEKRASPKGREEERYF